MRGARTLRQGEYAKPNCHQEAMRYFECSVGHRWLEPDAQAGTRMVFKSCIALGCQEQVVTRHMVSASYWWPNGVGA